ncbi:uncharacterized protein G2W53_003672 [Senna tora]|uniref:Uncharacterized protein n=1 Tax=Senna tora TaxID=362788 RepID=A0A834XAJ5_9FABA|nr:uncharacterized protein G2W53_003672 [Senna tora]
MGNWERDENFLLAFFHHNLLGLHMTGTCTSIEKT